MKLVSSFDLFELKHMSVSSSTFHELKI